MTTFIIGSRGSLLAKAQASYIKKQLEEITPYKFELKIIKTKGDEITDKPLWQLEGKDFFTRELDEALLNKEIDLVVHSYKDLGGERPKGIHLAAVTERVNPCDVLLVTKQTALKMINGKHKTEFILGTSSPRRHYQSQGLENFFPQKGLSIQVNNLRGNVDTRIKKLIANEYDGILLAAAGLERLSYSEEGYAILKELLPQLTYMLLPFHHAVPAPAQGALAIDCHEDAKQLRKSLDQLNDPITRECVYYEKKSFQTYGGGCHLPMGILGQPYKGGVSLIKKGLDQNKKPIDTYEIINDETLVTLSQYLSKPDNQLFLGMSGTSPHPQVVYDHLIIKKPILSPAFKNKAHYFATKHSLENLKNNLEAYELAPLFAAGLKSMKELAQAGYWCHGCTNSQGEESLIPHKNSRSFNLFHILENDWNIYTHQNSLSPLGEVIPSYERMTKNFTSAWVEKLSKCKYFVFTSYEQYKIYSNNFSFINEPDNHFFSGSGKTISKFKENNILCNPLPSFKWIFKTLEGKNE